MVNRPKDIGTRAESAVVKQILPYFPTAERLALKGEDDEGDIGHCGDFIFEVKGGKQTTQIGDGKLAKWMEEAEREAQNRGVHFGVLVTQRAGFGLPNARRWWAFVRIEDLAEICGGFYAPGAFAPVRLELGVFLDLLADQGYTPSQSEEKAPEIIELPVATAVIHLPDAVSDVTLFDDEEESFGS